MPAWVGILTVMTSPSEDETSKVLQAVADLHQAAVAGDFVVAAERAAAVLCSGAGQRLLRAPSELQQLVARAIEVGYAVALHDVLSGSIDGDLAGGRPELFKA
jgi:hypothetical protein